MNEALMGKMECGLICSKSLCFTTLHNRFFGKLGNAKTVTNSTIWSSIRHVYDKIRKNMLWVPGHYLSLNFWNFEWVHPPIADQLNLDETQRHSRTDKILDFWGGDNWGSLSYLPPHVRQQVLEIKLLDEFDTCLSRPGSMAIFIVKLFYQWL